MVREIACKMARKAMVSEISSSTERLSSDDPVQVRLLQEGIGVEPYYLFGKSGQPAGMKFLRLSHEIAYRFEAPDIVLIIYYKRIAEGRGRGICNPFSDFEWFLDFLKSKVAEAKSVKGLISRMGDDPSTLETSRISRFYRELLGGHTLGWEYGCEWIYKELAEWVPRRVYRNQGAHLKMKCDDGVVIV